MEWTFLNENKKFKEVVDFINKDVRLNIVGGNISFFSFLIWSIFKQLDKNFIIILPNERKSEIFYYDIINFIDKKIVKFLPSPDYNYDHPTETNYERVRTLMEIANSKERFILISYPLAVSKKIPQFDTFKNKICVIEKDKGLRRDYLLNFLFASGYEEKEIVEMPGEFARRGGIIDIFPLNSSFPLRINFVGNKVESIRKFEVSSQKSFEKIERFEICPLNEYYIGDENSDIFKEIENKISFFVEPDEVNFEYIKFIERKNYPVDLKIIEKFKRNSIFLTKRVYPEAEKFIYFNVFPVDERFKILPEKVLWQQNKDEKIFLFYESISDLEKLKSYLKEKNIFYKFNEIEGSLSSSFSFPEENITFLSVNDIFSRYKSKHPLLKKYKTVPVSSWTEIKEGDYVVHINEGIGIFKGFEKINVNGRQEEFIVIEYEGKDKLYVPVAQISLIHKYVGSKEPKLSKLPGKLWRKLKEKVKNSIKDIASQLYKLYTERKKERGIKFLPDDDLQNEFEQLFPYEETEDQKRAILDVKKDMMSEKIMDRIICGDSGYGKTEVAMRAAFKAVLSGKQVVVLVPTTVLALQHYLTFKERFAKFPVIIEMVSRLLSERKQKEILQQLKQGKIDIIIGTHRLLQEDVDFKDVGLLIIDEEQRFGVLQKE
ncbi:MAG: DEAD/DEAH box helicase, partial [Candidatus Omnitrophica bacterium]|nr:DEAD/DEAH box helicase [Candidatus Omnitrophota bacterium]